MDISKMISCLKEPHMNHTYYGDLFGDVCEVLQKFNIDQEIHNNKELYALLPVGDELDEVVYKLETATTMKKNDMKNTIEEVIHELLFMQDEHSETHEFAGKSYLNETNDIN